MSTTIELSDLAVSQPTSPTPTPSTHHTFGEDTGAGRDARWVRPALIALLVITAFAYFWDLSASGYANSFYAAAVQAGTKSWKAFFFGSIDSSNFITVDKPPASLWVMELSGRIFGFSSWSMLAPQALAGVASVGILYATVKRWFGAPAGLLAGAVLALTPVAALMFRYNNPDALLVLLLVASAYTITRALEKAGTCWLVATGALLGFAFLAKMMQAFTVVPASYFVYLLAAPTSLARRIKQLVVCTGALAVAAGWWVITVALWPVGSRPMIDGSPDNSIWNLIFDYNGFGRLVSSGAGGSGGGFSGATGLFRLFNDLMGGQASWLLPAALLALVTGLVVRFRAPRTDRTRAAVLLWGGWLVVTGAVFSFGQGVIHTYYTVALAPAVAALVAIGAVQLWQYRQHMRARVIGALGIVGTATWSYELLSRSPSYDPWLRIVVLAAGVLSAVALVLAPLATRYDRHLTRAWVGLGLIACLAGPAAFVGTTVTTAYTGSVPSAGPAVTSAVAGGGPQGGGGGGGAPSGAHGTTRTGTSPSSGSASSGAPKGSASSGVSLGTRPSGSSGTRPTASSGTTTPAAGRAAAEGHPGGGGGGGLSTSSELLRTLEKDDGSYRWVAATFGSQSAANLELGTSGDPVMAIGGFNNNGGNLTLVQFKAYVAAGDIHYFIASGGGGAGGGTSGSDAAISKWVAEHYTSTTIGGQTVYDLTANR